MKKLMYSILLSAGFAMILSACSSGDYVANPNSNGNNSVNPLNPLKADQFTWAGMDPVSVKINGNLWVADTAFYIMDTGGANLIYAYKDSFRQVMAFYFVNTWQGSLYNMGFKQYTTMVNWVPVSDSAGNGAFVYTSVLGNSGGMYLIQNDTMKFQGKFYAQLVNVKGDIINLSEGYFNLNKF